MGGKQRFETRAIHAGQEPDPATGATIVPVYQTVTFTQEAVGEHRGYEYSRTGNPTRAALETCLASLEGGRFGFAYGSGSADRSFGGYAGNDSFRTGYAVGGGVEYALPTDSFLNFFKSNAVTIKVEGLYVNLDRGNGLNGAFAVNNAGAVITTANPGVVVVSGGNLRRDTEFAVVRAGLNYKFGSY